MRVITKTEYVPTEEDRENDPNYTPLLTMEEQTEPVTLELNEPVEANGEMINELTINPPRAKSVLKSRSRNKKGEEESIRTDEFFARACNVPVETIGNLLIKDLNRLGDIIRAFTEQTPKVQD